MERRKIYATLVICGAVVVSIWLIARSSNRIAATETPGSVSVETRGNITTDADWQKILTTANQNSELTSVVPKDNAGSFDDTTLTAQMAKDFFGQYLNIANQGPVTQDEATAIANNVLSSAQYTKVTGAVYIASNLRINPKTDTATVRAYFDALNQEIKTKLPNNDDDPMTIVGQALKDNKESELTKLDPTIAAAHVFVSDLLVMPVPADAVSVHLGLLNASSNLLSSLEAMRATFSDPIKSFAGASQYGKYLSDFQTSLKNLTAYFQKKL